MKLLNICLVFLLLLSPAHSDLSEEEQAMIDSFMEEIIECRGMPGAAISLVRDGEVELARGYGYANVENNEAFTQNSLFAIASVSKSFTATLAAKLMANRPALDWYTIARDILGEDFHFVDGYRSNNTMLRDLLSHLTAIPRYDAIWALDPFDSREEIVMEKLRFMEEEWPFRSYFMYNNNMFSVLALILEQSFSQSWENLITQQLFDPIGMTSSTFYDVAGPDYDGFVTPYTYNLTSDDPTELSATPFETWNGAGLAGPAASICSTASDMGRWIQFVLKGGVTPDGDRIINIDDLVRLWYPESAYYDSWPGKPYEPVTDSIGNYGLGYFNGRYRGYRTHSHGGDLYGYHSEIYLLPHINIGTFFNTNFGGESGERYYVHTFLVDVLMGKEPAYNATEICRRFEDYDLREDDFNYIENRDRLRDLFSESEMTVVEGLGLVQYFAKVILDSASWFSVDKSQAAMLRNAKDLLEAQNNKPARAVENYEGVYGNFAHGNITVSASESCSGCLYMEYGTLGLYTLNPTNDTEIFMAFNYYPVFGLLPVRFYGDDGQGNAMYALLCGFEVYAPPVFERDLRMSDAPAPRNDLCTPIY